jgi:hypothetical protein
MFSFDTSREMFHSLDQSHNPCTASQVRRTLFWAVISSIVLLATLGWSATLKAGELAHPRIEVFKANRELKLYDGDKLIKTYRVALGSNPIPPKERRDDRATPEGSYFICQKNPQSRFHLSLAINYPNAADARRGLDAGLISHAEYETIVRAATKHKMPPWTTKLGGEVFVHGNGTSRDWTWGCIALEDSDIEDLYRRVPVNTPITIYP